MLSIRLHTLTSVTIFPWGFCPSGMQEGDSLFESCRTENKTIGHVQQWGLCHTTFMSKARVSDAQYSLFSMAHAESTTVPWISAGRADRARRWWRRRWRSRPCSPYDCAEACWFQTPLVEYSPACCCPLERTPGPATPLQSLQTDLWQRTILLLPTNSWATVVIYGIPNYLGVLN